LWQRRKNQNKTSINLKKKVSQKDIHITSAKQDSLGSMVCPIIKSSIKL
jgi:hypothetical protein